jgi:peptidoglycan DL-endopeptidase CwlO
MHFAARSVVGMLAGCMVIAGGLATNVAADPAGDAMAKLNELNEKLAAQQAADKKHADDQAAVQASADRLGTFQTAVNKLAAATYMGGRVDGLDAMLTADSPQQLIDTMAVQRVMARQMSTQMASFRTAGAQARTAEEASAKSAAEAKSAADQAAAVRASLQSKQSQLQVQIAVVKSQYVSLSPGERTALADPGPVPAGLPAPDALPPGAPPNGPPPPGDAPPQGGFPGFFPPPPGGSGDRATVVEAALTQVGSPYVWGGAAPGGFDCSGLVMWAFQQAGVALPHSSQALAQGGQPVALSDLQPGDVLTFYSDASHAGLYVGDGMMIHSSTYGVPVRVVPMNSSGPIFDARRY